MKQVSELSDAELSELFAVKVAAIPEESVKRGFTNMGKREDGSLWGCSRIPDFATNANAVLPWLEKAGYSAACGVNNENIIVTTVRVSCEITRGVHKVTATGPNALPRAACIALLAAKGITEVEP